MARRLLLVVIVLIIETQCKNYTEAPIHIKYNKSITSRIMAKREIKCNLDEYTLDSQCCKKCERGFVKNTNCPKDVSKHCVQCENGKEYTDHANDFSKCLRCKLCDSEFGLEVARNCTPVQNTECTCAKNHFCNSSVPCMHCDRCTTCEGGIIKQQCTSTSDTVCGTKELPGWAIAMIVVLLVSVIVAVIYYCMRKQRCFTSKENPGEVVFTPKSPFENVPLIYPDIDLSSHIPGIVGEMTLQDVKTFVRKHNVEEPVIDQVIHDYCSDTSEQKIKLFQVWYQRHGIKGAYGTLISSLRELKMCTEADKIEEKLKPAVSSSQKMEESYNDDTEHSKTCNQEGRSSYNESIELSQSCSGTLEKT